MALPPTQIFYSRYTALPFLLVGSFLLFVLTLMFFAEQAPAYPLIYIGYAAGLVVVFFGWRWFIGQLKVRRPALTFHSDGLEIHKDGSFIAWSRVTEWKIRSDKGGDYLIMRTPEGKRRINVRVMDRPKGVIRDLVKQYIAQPGPGIVPRRE
jgi:cytochrome c biogenesis protein CcdA